MRDERWREHWEWLMASIAFPSSPYAPDNLRLNCFPPSRVIFFLTCITTTDCFTLVYIMLSIDVHIPYVLIHTCYMLCVITISIFTESCRWRRPDAVRTNAFPFSRLDQAACFAGGCKHPTTSIVLVSICPSATTAVAQGKTCRQ